MAVPASPSSRPTFLWPAVLAGVGLAGTVDQVILHQLLHWHTFYDRSGRDAGLVSDGWFHVASAAALAAGIGWLCGRIAGDGAHRWVARRGVVAGTLVGLGGFNLFDATVIHKVLRLHQVRPAAADWLPYDLVYGGLAVGALVVGLLLWPRSTRGARMARPS